MKKQGTVLCLTTPYWQSGVIETHILKNNKINSRICWCEYAIVNRASKKNKQEDKK
jgi:hypothetical protein